MSKTEFKEQHKAIFIGFNEVAIGEAFIHHDNSIYFKKPSILGRAVPTRLVLSRDDVKHYDDYDLYDSNGEKIRVYRISIVDLKSYSIAGDTERKLRADNEQLKKNEQFLINTIEEQLRDLESRSIPDIGLRDAVSRVEAYKKLNTYTGFSSNNNNTSK